MPAVRSEDDDVERGVVERAGIRDGGARHLPRAAAPREPVDRRLRGDVPDRELAEAGAGGRAEARVAVVPRADDGGIADATRIFVGPAARRHRGRDVTPAVEGQEVDRAALLADRPPD